MPGALPAKFTKLTFVPRDVRIGSTVNLATSKPETTAEIAKRLEELSRAVQELGKQLEASSQSAGQNFSKLSSSLQATQDSLNSVIDHLTP